MGYYLFIHLPVFLQGSQKLHFVTRHVSLLANGMRLKEMQNLWVAGNGAVSCFYFITSHGVHVPSSRLDVMLLFEMPVLLLTWLATLCLVSVYLVLQVCRLSHTDLYHTSPVE